MVLRAPVPPETFQQPLNPGYTLLRKWPFGPTNLDQEHGKGGLRLVLRRLQVPNQKPQKRRP